MIRASIDAQPEAWPDRMPALLTAYRVTRHLVTGISPKMAMLGPGLATGFSHCAAAGGARRSHTSFAAEFRQNMRNEHASFRSATSRAAKTQKN